MQVIIDHDEYQRLIDAERELAEIKTRPVHQLCHDHVCPSSRTRPRYHRSEEQCECVAGGYIRHIDGKLQYETGEPVAPDPMSIWLWAYLNYCPIDAIIEQQQREKNILGYPKSAEQLLAETSL